MSSDMRTLTMVWRMISWLQISYWVCTGTACEPMKRHSASLTMAPQQCSDNAATTMYLIRQLAIEQEIGNLQEVGFLRELLDRIATVPVQCA